MMVRFLWQSSWAMVVLLVFGHQSTHAQLMGNQSIGTPALSLSQQRTAAANAAAAPSLGGIGGASNAIGSIGNRLQVNNTRFVRGSRNRQDFVGSNRTDQTGFVGSGQALGVGRVPSATENLRIETSKAKINRPLPPQPAKGMYYPRLEVDWGRENLGEEDLPKAPESAANTDAVDRVTQFSEGTARLTMAGSTAILRGTVHSKRTEELLVQILSFEPGIDRVKSELEVR